MGKRRPSRLGRILRPGRGADRDPKKDNAIKIKTLAKLPPQRIPNPPLPDGAATAYYRQLATIASEMYKIVQRTVIAALWDQQRLAEEYTQDADNKDKRRRAARQNRPHTPEEKEHLNIPEEVVWSEGKMDVWLNLYAKGIPAEKIAGSIAARTEKFTLNTQAKILQGLGLNPIPPGSQLEQYRDTWIQTNADLIVSQPRALADHIGQIVREMVPQGHRWETIAERLEKENGILRSRARLIARDQVQKYNSDLTRIQQRNAGFDYYQWRGARDNRERPAHVALEGTVWSWDNPPIIGNPGEPIQCRCVAIPVYSDKLIAQAESPQKLNEEMLIERTAELGATQRQAPALNGLAEEEKQKLIKERATREVRNEIRLARRREVGRKV